MVDHKRRVRARVFAVGGVTALVIGLAVGCDTQSQERAPVRERAVVDDRPVRVALALAAPHADVTRLLMSLPEPLVWEDATSARLTSSGWRAAKVREFDRLGARLPRSASGTFDVGISQIDRLTIHFALVGAADVTVELDGDRAVYAGAYPETDVIVAAGATRFEELLLLRGPRAPTTFAWRVALPTGLRVEAAATSVRFVDANGRAALHVPEPFAVDVAGHRRAARIAYDAGALVVSLDTQGMSFPILLDPTIETSTWTKLTPAASPSARAYTVLAYDSARGKIVLFGGEPSDAQTWEWDGLTWAQKMPTNAPSLRGAQGMTYDKKRGKTVLFSGNDRSTINNDTWEWDGTDWAKRTPATSPMARDFADMAYDSRRQVVVLYGGSSHVAADGGADAGTTSFYPKDTWEWNGTDWTQKMPAKNHGIGGDGMVYDATRGYMTAFDFYTPTTWTFDGLSWTDRAVMVIPPPRYGYGLAFDTLRGRTVLYGGITSSSSQPLGDTWEWDGTAWIQMMPATSPPPLSAPALAFDEGRKQVILFGGEIANRVKVNETWSYAAYGGSCTAATQCDTGFCVDGVCCSQAKCGVCGACNLEGSVGTCASVKTAQHDVCSGSRACDANGVCLLMDGQVCSVASQCLTARCTAGVCCDAKCGTCEMGTGNCLGAVQCDGDHTTHDSNGQPLDCSPFKCESGGGCKKTCASVGDCVAPAVCDNNQRCIAPAAASSGGSGGCAVRPTKSTHAGVGALALALGVIVARRRRRRPAP